MRNDKRPPKYAVLAGLVFIAFTAALIFSGMRAKAQDERFLNIQEITTPGGISVWLAEEKTLPIIALRFAFMGSGSALDAENKQGLARMLSNTMDEGAGDLDSTAFQKALADHSIDLTFSAPRDAFEGKLVTLTRNKDKAFELLSMAINSPRFDAEPVARMRDGNIARIRSALTEPDWMAARLVNDRAYAGHPYAMNSGGTLSSLPTITPEDLRAFHDKNLMKDRLVVTAAGDINKADIAAAIDRIFAKLPDGTGPAQTPDMALQNTGKIYIYDQDVPQSFIEVLLPAFGHKDADFYALQILNYIYGGAGFGSRLMEEVREKRGLTYGIYSSVQDYRHTQTLGVSLSTKNESAAEALNIIKAEMVKMTGVRVSDKELSDAKSYITGSMPLALDSTESIANMMLSLRTDGLPSTYLDHYATRINAVSAADIERVAKRVLKPESMLTIIVGKPQNIETFESIKELPNVR